MAKKQIKPHAHQVESPEKMITLRIEYVGILAIACLVIGVIIGSSFFGVSAPAPTQVSYDQLVQAGNEAYDNNNPHMAIPAYEKALSLRPNDPNVLTDLGVMYKSVGEYDKAVQQFKKAAAIAPTHAFSRYNLGIVLMQDLHDHKGAIAAFEEFLKLAPTDEKAGKAREFIQQLSSEK